MKKFLLHFIFSLGIVFFASAQYDDAGLWTTINVEKKLKNNFSISIREEFRLKENFGRLNLFYTDLGVSYRPRNFIKLSLAYRLSEKFKMDNTFSLRHRLMFDIGLRKKFGHYTISYRLRTQSEVRDVYSSEKGAVPEWYIRNKVELKYDIGKKITPYASVELRYQWSDPRNLESDQTWNRGRYAFGFEYELNKRNTLGFYYLIQHEWNVSLPENLYIIELEYSLTL